MEKLRNQESFSNGIEKCVIYKKRVAITPSSEPKGQPLNGEETEEVWGVSYPQPRKFCHFAGQPLTPPILSKVTPLPLNNFKVASRCVNYRPSFAVKLRSHLRAILSFVLAHARCACSASTHNNVGHFENCESDEGEF